MIQKKMKRKRKKGRKERQRERGLWKHNRSVIKGIWPSRNRQNSRIPLILPSKLGKYSALQTGPVDPLPAKNDRRWPKCVIAARWRKPCGMKKNPPFGIRFPQKPQIRSFCHRKSAQLPHHSGKTRLVISANFKKNPPKKETKPIFDTMTTVH